MANRKNFLDRKFQHHSWFKEGVTVGYALDSLAKSGDFILDKKPSTKQSNRLFDPVIYDDVLRYVGKEGGSYRLSVEEKEYFLQRKEYWKEQKTIEHQKWLNEEIDIEKALKNYLCMNSHYDMEDKLRQLQYWKNYKVDDKSIREYGIDEKEKARLIKSWEDKVKRVSITKVIIDNLISQNKEKIRTNREFKQFEELINKELSKVVKWNTDRAGWDLIA